MASLESVANKLSYARMHQETFKAVLARYLESKPGAMVRDADSPDDSPTFTFKVITPIPFHLGLILGDCLQNARSALDYLVWELVIANKHVPGKPHMFPVCTTDTGFKKALKAGRLEGIAPEAIRLIDALQPYHAGDLEAPGLPLAVLDELVNINKHRRMVLTVIRSVPEDEMLQIKVGNELWDLPSMSAMQANTNFGQSLTPEQMNTYGSLSAYVAINEGTTQGMEATLIARALCDFVAEEVAMKFRRFFQ